MTKHADRIFSVQSALEDCRCTLCCNALLDLQEIAKRSVAVEQSLTDLVAWADGVKWGDLGEEQWARARGLVALAEATP